MRTSRAPLRRIPFVSGKACPRCDHRTIRRRTPALLRPIRVLLLGRGSFRECRHCYGWRGFALHV